MIMPTASSDPETHARRGVVAEAEVEILLLIGRGLCAGLTAGRTEVSISVLVRI